MNINGMEIEHKYLIHFPDVEFLKNTDNAVVYDITQDYLLPVNSGVNRRVRKRSTGDMTEYFYTQKSHITDLKRIEIEKTISENEYLELLKEKDPERNTIAKQRIGFYYSSQFFETDIFPFWTDRALMELEVESEEQAVMLPPFIEVIKEVTSDKRYTNSALAINIPFDNISSEEN